MGRGREERKKGEREGWDSQCTAQASLPEASRQFGFLIARLLVSEHLKDETEACEIQPCLGSQVCLPNHATAEIGQEHYVQREKMVSLL